MKEREVVPVCLYGAGKEDPSGVKGGVSSLFCRGEGDKVGVKKFQESGLDLEPTFWEEKRFCWNRWSRSRKKGRKQLVESWETLAQGGLLHSYLKKGESLSQGGKG